MQTKVSCYPEKLKKETLVITKKKSYFKRLKETILDTQKFQHIKTEEEQPLNFILKSNKRVLDL